MPATENRCLNAAEVAGQQRRDAVISFHLFFVLLQALQRLPACHIYAVMGTRCQQLLVLFRGAYWHCSLRRAAVVGIGRVSTKELCRHMRRCVHAHVYRHVRRHVHAQRAPTHGPRAYTEPVHTCARMRAHMHAHARTAHVRTHGSRPYTQPMHIHTARARVHTQPCMHTCQQPAHIHTNVHTGRAHTHGPLADTRAAQIHTAARTRTRTAHAHTHGPRTWPVHIHRQPACIHTARMHTARVYTHGPRIHTARAYAHGPHAHTRPGRRHTARAHTHRPKHEVCSLITPGQVNSKAQWRLSSVFFVFAIFLPKKCDSVSGQQRVTATTRP